jgi:exodeoxyribonuclease III
MLILSWNVAGLSTTVNRIHDNYQPKSAAHNGGKSKSSSVSKHSSADPALAEYFSRHGATILCLQEHKIPKQQLSNRQEPRQCSNIAGFESFWSCCVDDTKKGLNGVVTYAPTGTVLVADPAPLGSPDLDQQGRCIMTDHGSFVLFNVYIPNTGGQSLSYKMKFLHALRRAMNHQRQVCKKPVILVGDYNISHACKDVFWKDRVVHIHDVLEQVNADRSGVAVPRWKVDLATHWSKIENTLQTAEVVETQTSNSLTKEKFKKFRFAVTVDNRRILLGRNESSPEYCRHSYDLNSSYYHDVDTDQEVLSKEENILSVETLAELMLKIAGVEWDEATQRSIATVDATIRRVSPPRQWLSDVLQQDGMVDAFRHFYPEAEARFTCWHQFMNKRYVNDGARIDYTLIDSSLLPLLQKGNVDTLRCCGGDEQEDALGETAALRAVTANGRYQPASFEGGGIVEASQEALDTQFGPAHTGIVYTPPSFSDHIGVSLLLDDEVLPRDLVLNESDAATRKAQPHKLQKSIVSFFSNAAAASEGTKPKAKPKVKALPNVSKIETKRAFFSGSKAQTQPSASTGISKRLKPAPKVPAAKKSTNTILHHFRPGK